MKAERKSFKNFGASRAFHDRGAMKSKLLVLCFPLFGGCGGVVELGPIEQEQPPATTEFEHTLVQLAPLNAGMCALFTDERIRCWSGREDTAWTMPKLTGVSIWAGVRHVCAVQHSGRVACIRNICKDLPPPDDDSPKGCSYGPEEPFEIPGVENALRLTENGSGIAMLSDGRIQQIYSPVSSSCPEHISPELEPDCFPTATEPFEADERIVGASGRGDFVTVGGSAYSTGIHYNPAVLERTIVPNDIGTYPTLPALRIPGVDDALEIEGNHVLHSSGKVTAFAWIPCAGPGTAVATQGSERVECLDGVVALRSNGFGTCALRSDGSLWCWGESITGELGVIEKTLLTDDPYNEHWDYSAVLDEPYQLPTVEGVRDFSLGGWTTCVVRGKNEVSCWGFRGMDVEPTTVPQRIRFQ